MCYIVLFCFVLFLCLELFVLLVAFITLKKKPQHEFGVGLLSFDAQVGLGQAIIH